MKKLFYLGLIMSIFSFSNSNAEPKDASKATMGGLKIAYVTVQKIVTIDPKALPNAAAEWRDLYNKLQDVLKPAEKELKDLENKFEQGKKEFETMREGRLTTEDALKRKYEEVSRMEYELRKKLQERQAYAEEELAKAQSVVGPKIDKVIDSIRVKKGLDVIFRGEVILSADSKLDMTNEVLQQLNKEYNDEKAKKAAAQAKAKA